MRQEQYDALEKEKKKLEEKIQNIEDGEIVRCRECGKVKKAKDFFDATDTNLDLNGKMSVCKNCINSYCHHMLKTSESNYEKAIYETCKRYNVAYTQKIFDEVMKDRIKFQNMGRKFNLNTLFGKYKSKLTSLNKTSVYTFEYNQDVENKQQEITKEEVKNEKNEDYLRLKKIWRLELDYEILLKMQELYEFLNEYYKSQSNMHVIALQEYCMYATLRDDAICKGGSNVKQYSDMADKAAAKAKIDPKNLSKADLSEGLNSISEISQRFAKHRDVIRIFPKYTKHPNDVIDFNLYEYINYIRKMQGKEEVEYKEIWQFYDKKVKKFIDTYGDINGIFSEFDEDELKQSREKIEKFIREDEEIEE